MKCRICEADAAASAHFGVSSCSACAAFFRRTITLDRKYTCSRNNKCDVNQHIRNVCRHCRMQKCLECGMDPLGVQPKRDPIRQSSVSKSFNESKSSPELPKDQQTLNNSNVKKEAITNDDEQQNKSIAIAKELAAVSKIFSKTGQLETSIIAEISNAYQQLEEKRRNAYASIVVKGIYDRATDRKYACDMDQAMKMKFNEFVMCGEFTNAIGQFANLFSTVDKFDLFKQFAYVFECIDLCFRNRENNWIETNQIMLPDRTWMDMNKLKEFYMSGETMQMHADPDMAVRMFEPSMKQVKNELAVPMQAIEISDEETFALIGLVLFDGDNLKVSMETRMQCRYIRNRLFRELMEYCVQRGGSHDGPVRFATVVLLITATNRLRTEAKELFSMIKMFDMFDYPKVFDEVYP